MPAALSDLHARLVHVELEAQIGTTWFESWIELLRLEDGADNVPEALLELAKRMDKILSVSMNNTATKELSGGNAAAEKRSFEQVEAPTAGKKEDEELEVPAKKKPVEEPQPVAAASSSAEVANGEETEANLPQKAEEPKPVEVNEPAKASLPPKAPEPEKPASKLAAFLTAAEVPVTYSTTPVKTPAASSPKPASPSSPAQAKAPSSPSSIAKPPTSPSGVTKAPPSPSAVPKAPSSPASAVPKAPSSPSTIAKAPSSPSPARPVEVATKTVSPPSSPSVVAKPSEQPMNAGQPEATDSPKTMVKKSEGGHMEIPSDCEQLFNEIKIRKKHRYIILKIQDWRLQVTKVAPRTATFDDFLKDLPFSDCCYAVYDHERLKADQYGSRVAAKVFYITWQPVPAPTQLKMLYSTERRTLSSVFKGIEDIVATKKDDILVACGEKGKFDDEDSEDEERGGKGDWMDD